MKHFKRLGLLLLMVFFMVLVSSVPAQAKGTLHGIAVCGWPEKAKKSQELMCERMISNDLASYDCSEDIGAYTYDYEVGTTKKIFNQHLDINFKDSTSEDLNIFYYAGHTTAGIDENGNIVEAYGLTLSSGSGYYAYEDLAKQLASYKGTFVVILDTCCAEAFYTDGVSTLSAADKKRFSCILSCGYEEESQFGAVFKMPYTYVSGNAYGKFTYALGKGLGFWNGEIEADSNGDGDVTVGELADYAKSNTKALFQTMTVKSYTTDSLQVVFSYSSISLNKSKLSLYEDQTRKVKATTENFSGTVKWSSSDKSIATVGSSGRIKAKKAGAVTITAKANNKKATCKVTVKSPTIELNKAKATLSVGKTLKLKATVKGASTTVTWTSSNKSVATVSKTGKVTAKKEGTVTIRAKANGKTAKCKITVSSAKTRALKAYKEFLAQDTIKWPESNTTTVELSKCTFSLVYIDNNSVPELVLGCGSNANSHADGYYALYTYKNGKVKFVTNLMDGFSYFKKKGIFCAIHSGTGGYETYYFKLSNGKAKWILHSVDESILNYDSNADGIIGMVYKKVTKSKTPLYSSTTKNVSASSFKKLLKEYVGTKKNSVPTAHKNTSANRKKYLK